MKYVFVLLFTFCCIVLWASRVEACYCVVPDVAGALEHANAVFLGDVIEITPPDTTDEHAKLADQLSTIKFKVVKSWKGINLGTTEISVRASQRGIGCLEPPLLLKGGRYLVYADPAFGEPGLSIIMGCGGRTAHVLAGLTSSGRFFDTDNPFADMKRLDTITSGLFKFNFNPRQTSKPLWKSPIWKTVFLDFDEM